MKTLMIIHTSHCGSWFVLTYLASFLIAALLVIRFGKLKTYPADTWLLIVLSGVIFFIIGEKAFTFTPEQWFRLFGRFILPPSEGKATLGGIAGLIAGLWLAKVILDFRRPVFDSLAVGLPLAMAVSRIGCHLAGCCFGSPADLPWGIRYEAGSQAWQAHAAHGMILPGATESLMVHPVQLYQAAGCLLIALLAWRMHKVWKNPGSGLVFSVLAYLVLRFATEFASDPETSFLAGQAAAGLKIVQWLNLAGILVLGATLYIRETHIAHAPPAVSPGTPWRRKWFLAAFLLVTATALHRWFDLLENTITWLFLIPVLTITALRWYRDHTVPAARRILPVLALCSTLFMAQRSIPEWKKGDKTTFTELGLTGMFGRYSEELLNVDDKVCGSPRYTSLGRQSVPYRQFGFTGTYNIWKGDHVRYAVGGRIFVGSESPETDTKPRSGPAYGISPYATLDWEYWGFMAGFSVGNLKIPIREPDDYIQPGDIIPTKASWATFVPAIGLRVGPKEVLYAEASFPGNFPASIPALFQAGVATGMGKNDGRKIGIGYCSGMYFTAAYPVTKYLVMNVSYTDNFQREELATRSVSIGLSCRFDFRTTQYVPPAEPVRVYREPRRKPIPGYGRGIAPGGEVMEDVDGNRYPTIVLAGKHWMATNLRTRHYRDSSSVQGITEKPKEPGLLYTWYAAGTGNLCPAGWHIPSADEWEQLVQSLGGGKKAWNKLEGAFMPDGNAFTFWTSQEYDSLTAGSYYMERDPPQMTVARTGKPAGLTVRCVRDN